MLPSPPTLVYNRPHHWIWMVRQLMRLGRFLVIWFCLLIFTVLLAIGNTDFQMQITALIATGLLVAIGTGCCSYVYVDWRSRTIHLYSDGRLDYEFGILHREGRSVSMRFGSVRYMYHNRLATWLDCADVILPFDSGTIEAIAGFRHFWVMAQGRV